MKTCKILWFLLILILITPTGLHAQREADNWVFGYWAGLNFSTGDPVPFYYGPISPNLYLDGTEMSDTLGNLLFLFGNDIVYNNGEEIMQNGTGILPGHDGWRQTEIAVPMPGSDTKYYIFSVSGLYFLEGLYYSVIDMTLDGGKGAVTGEKNIKLEAASPAQDKIFALKNSTGDGYWVITRLFNDDRYASFRVTASGVDPVPVYSPTGIYRPFSSGSGPMRVSPDKKHLASCYWTDLDPPSALEICEFNAETGIVTFNYLIEPYGKGKHLSGEPSDCEFSPDSKYLYVQWLGISFSEDGIYQYNMKLADDSAAFYNSGILLVENRGASIQLSNDGRIYFTYVTDPELWDIQEDYLGVINRPWEMGTACEVDTFGIYLGGRETSHFLPNIMLDFLYRFEWEADNYCQGSAVHFIPHFIPTPDSIRWFFDEFAPGSVSYELSPTYTFLESGIHEVAVDIWYPTGRFEHTSREIEIFPVPYPDLGPDTLICKGSSLTLNANCLADMYSWSTGQFGSPSIVISDTGTYWARASFLETGCFGYDTIHVGFHPATLLDESELVITPTSCSGTTGSITGITALGPTPFAFQWLDLSGNPFGTDIDATNLPAGQYFLTVTDGNGCTSSSSTFIIIDAGNLQVSGVQFLPPHCHNPDGQIVISAFSPPGSVLEYSVDDGNTYFTDSVFNNLSAGEYLIKIRDNFGCEGFYLENPLILEDILGPQVLQVTITDETDFSGNGVIEIDATGATPVIFYSIDSGATYQSNNGTFNNLGSRIYDCIILDQNGCDTSFTVEVKNVILTYLHAVTGEGGHCLGNAAIVPVNVDNFNSVASFQLKLSYNADNLQCEGFTTVHPQLIDSFTGWVDQAAGAINLAWNSPVPVTFGQSETITELVFTTKSSGDGDIEWYTGVTESFFASASGLPIPAEFSTGQVLIYEPPKIPVPLPKNACQGDMVSFSSYASGNQLPITFQWIYPDGSITEEDPFFFNVTMADAGDYILLATDYVGCTDQEIIHLEVGEDPVAAFHGSDTLEMHTGDVLDAGPGMASYRWSPGDTSQSIVIQAQGMYLVEMESLLGCVGTDSVYVKLVEDEIPEFGIYIPNAFSPNGDGINDIFQIQFPNLTFNIQNLALRIFDRWGGEVYSGNEVTSGWDGKKNGHDCPGGVYVYLIHYTIEGIPGEQVKKGNVMLIR
jgi:gliding motility-associated-like protein